MKNFEYAAPRTEGEVVELLSVDPDKTAILAGGTDLIGLMKRMVLTPERVVNIMEVPGLQSIDRLPDGRLAIGAAVTLDDVLASSELEPYPAIAHAILGINSMQLQSQGTFGGELCRRPNCWFFRDGYGLLAGEGQRVAAGDNRFHAILGNSGPAKFVSSSRIAPALIALDAKLRIIGPQPDEEQYVDVADFFRAPRHEGQRETILAPNQLLTHILLPTADNVRSATYEVRHGEGPDPPLAAAAVALELEAGIVQQARVVMGHVAPTPWVAREAEQMLVGLTINDGVAESAAEMAVSAATPLSNNEYKVQLARVAVKRAILLSAGLETGGF